jgi:hypothetical protein
VQTIENRRSWPPKNFEAIILQAVDDALIELGESVREVVYFEVARNGGIKKEEIPQKFYQFICVLRKEFGNGSKTIEALILEKLFGKVGSTDVFQKTAAIMILLSSERKQKVKGNASCV